MIVQLPSAVALEAAPTPRIGMPTVAWEGDFASCVRYGSRNSSGSCLPAEPRAYNDHPSRYWRRT